MKITVFTSSFNYAKYLRQSIESVLSQTYEDFEYHLIDYGSTDETWTIINEYTSDKRIIAMQIGEQPNKVFSMNHSIRRATGNYWAWCPADDCWCSNLLERKVIYAKNHPDAVLYNEGYLMDDGGKIKREIRLPNYTQKQIKKEIWKRSLIPFTGIFIPMYIFRQLGIYFPEDENIGEDYYWSIQAVTRGVPFIKVPELLHYKRRHDGSVSGRYRDGIIKNMFAIQNKLKKGKDNYSLARFISSLFFK